LIRLRVLLKWILFAVVLGYVCYHGYRLWNQSDVRQQPLSAAGVWWLVASGVVYTLSWLPSIWFWRQLMHALAGRVKFRDAARAYYCGQLGKYIPGKAMVLVIRGAMVKDRGGSALTGTITAAYETLTMMGTGVAVGAALAPLLFQGWITAHAPWLNLTPLLQTAIATIVVTVLILLLLPLISRMLTWIAAKVTPVSGLAQSEQKSIPPRLIGVGCLAFLLSWALQGLSLGMTLSAVDETGFHISAWPLWTGAMALSTSLGFAVLFAPGGLGVREGILLAILNSQPGISAPAAVAVTVLSRVVSFVAELVVSTVLFMAIRRTGERPFGKRPSAELGGSEKTE
jgi:uncharacterized membrane protein YbhN (UPF0104 family)